MICSKVFSSYFVRKLHEPNSPELEFIFYDLYPLPSSLKPCETIDTSDTRYLNQKPDSFVIFFEQTLEIDFCNENKFNKPIQTSTPPIEYDHDSLNIPGNCFPPFPSVSELHKEPDICPSKK